MPAALTKAAQTLPLPFKKVQPFHLVAALFIFLASAGVGALSTQASSIPTRMHPMYPAAQAPVALVDDSTYTVAELVAKLPITDKFYLLLYNGGALNDLAGPGPYTIFAPADHYFDYLPHDAYVGADATAKHTLAERHVMSGQIARLDTAHSDRYLTLAGNTVAFDASGDGSASIDGAFVIAGYKAKNGVLYIINKVLVP